jgi:hypothetical protein
MKNIDKRLDDYTSIHVKLSNTDEHGWGYCYTCTEPKPLHYKDMDCGHYPNVPREHTQFRWDVDSKIHKPQCSECNRFEHGLAEPFRDRLVSELGFEEVSRIEFDAHKPYQEWTNEAKKKHLDKLRSECKAMLKDKMFGITLP